MADGTLGSVTGIAWPSSTYRELPPPGPLAPYVECIWGQAVEPRAEAYDQPVLPDGCIDLVAIDGRLRVAGPATRSTIVVARPGTVSVGIRFRPGAAPPLLGVGAAELRDQEVALGALWGRAGAMLEARAMEAPHGAARRDVLVGEVLRRLEAASAPDPVAVHVAAALRGSALALPPLAGPTDRSLRRIAAEVELSERQLRRRIDDAVGYSPRTLARILRFQRFLEAARVPRPDGRGRDLAALAVAAGYADQSHLTRESRRLAGLPPAALLDWEDRRLAR